MKTVYLVCGVPASGKTWVCRQLDQFTYIPHDDYIKVKGGLIGAIVRAAKGEKPVITECPFAEREMRESLMALGFKVIPIFIVEPVQTIMKRYLAREGKAPTKSTLTRALSIKNRAIEWNASWGSSEDVLTMLKAVSP